MAAAHDIRDNPSGRGSSDREFAHRPTTPIASDNGTASSDIPTKPAAQAESGKDATLYAIAGVGDLDEVLTGYLKTEVDCPSCSRVCSFEGDRSQSSAACDCGFTFTIGRVL